MNKPLTKAQAAGLAKLIAYGGQYPIHRIADSNSHDAGVQYSKTGVNTTVLSSLAALGYIRGHIYRNGVVSNLTILKTE